MTRQPKLLSPPKTQSGFTIIECLVALIVVSILMVAIAPVIALSVANRVQARRAEQATQAARDYIDGVRSGKIEPPANTKLLNEVRVVPGGPNAGNVFTPNRDGRNGFAGIEPPNNAALNCPDSQEYCNPKRASLYCVDLDGNGCKSSSSRDFVIQAFRSVRPLDNNPNQADPSDKGEKGYLLGVRVYRADAFDGGDPLETTLDRKGRKVKTWGNSTAFANSVDRKAPFVELTTEVRGESTDFQSLCKRLGGDCSN